MKINKVHYKTIAIMAIIIFVVWVGVGLLYNASITNFKIAEDIEYVDTIFDTHQIAVANVANVYYINGTNITDLEAHTQYLVLNGDVYSKSFAPHNTPVFEEYNIVVIPNDEQPRFYFETLSIERCNEAILIGDNECYNHSYQKLHLFVEENVAFTLQEYGYNYVIDLSNYTIVYD